MNLSKFLDEEKKKADTFLAVVMQDDTNTDKVKIKSWNKEGCGCSNSLSVDKSFIESVEKTEHTHYCCGQTHAVVKVNFTKNASIALEDAFKQMASKHKPNWQIPMGMYPGGGGTHYPAPDPQNNPNKDTVMFTHDPRYPVTEMALHKFWTFYRWVPKWDVNNCWSYGLRWCAIYKDTAGNLSDDETEWAHTWGIGRWGTCLQMNERKNNLDFTPPNGLPDGPPLPLSILQYH